MVGKLAILSAASSALSKVAWTAAHREICWAARMASAKVVVMGAVSAGRTDERMVGSRVVRMVCMSVEKMAVKMVGKLAILSAVSLALSKVAWRAAHLEICWAARMASTKVVVMGAVSAGRTDEKMVG